MCFLGERMTYDSHKMLDLEGLFRTNPVISCYEVLEADPWQEANANALIFQEETLGQFCELWRQF
jgi:hypothetical protein